MSLDFLKDPRYFFVTLQKTTRRRKGLRGNFLRIKPFDDIFGKVVRVCGGDYAVDLLPVV